MFPCWKRGICMNCNDKLLKILSESSYTDEISPGLRLKEDLGFDSLRVVELLITLEEKFDIAFDMSDLDPAKLMTAGDIIQLVDRYI